MVIAEIVGTVVGAMGRFIGHMLVEIVFEYIVKGTGYVALKLVRWGHTPSDRAASTAGLLIWSAAIGYGIWSVLRAGH